MSAGRSLEEILAEHDDERTANEMKDLVQSLLSSPEDRWYILAWMAGSLVPIPGYEVHADVIYSTDGEHPSYTITGPAH